MGSSTVQLDLTLSVILNLNTRSLIFQTWTIPIIIMTFLLLRMKVCVLFAHFSYMA